MDDSESPFDLLHFALVSFIRRTSLPFRFPPVVFSDRNRSPWTITNHDGVTLIAAEGLSQKPKKERFPLKVTFPGDSDVPRDVQILSAELTDYTAELYDIEILELTFTWGIKEGKPPSLVHCDGKYRANCVSFSAFLHDIVFFIAVETSQIIEPGKCFSRRGVCVSADMSCAREKVVLQRVKKLGNVLKPLDPSEFLCYVKSRIEETCPIILVGRVPVCKNCFSLYARDKIATPKFQTPPLIVRRSVLVMSRTPPSFELSTQSGQQFYRTSPSGLTYVQSTSVKSAERAQKTYLSPPFPPYRQHPV
jgi:hypothetical protein